MPHCVYTGRVVGRDDILGLQPEFGRFLRTFRGVMGHACKEVILLISIATGGSLLLGASLCLGYSVFVVNK